jgi:K+-transporting ATPase ATPase C chain
MKGDPMLASALRLIVSTLVICSIAYPLAVLAVGKALNPDGADGQLIARGGVVVGSRQVAQRFEAPHYLWPRPSAVDFNGAAAGGSNKSPTNPELADRAKAEIARFGATAARPLPVELATASGAGLDPHISLQAALYQAPRIAAARGVPEAAVRRLLEAEAASNPLLAPVAIVNVLETNLALDDRFPLEARGG